MLGTVMVALLYAGSDYEKTCLLTLRAARHINPSTERSAVTELKQTLKTEESCARKKAWKNTIYLWNNYI